MATTIPKIIYGTAWKKERTTDLVVKAVLQGFRAIDTACQPKHYREDLVGDALEILKEKHGVDRSQLFLQTKYTSIDGQDRRKPLPYDPKSSISSQVHASFATSLKNLKTDRIDAILLHGPLDTLELTLEAWKALVSLKEEDRVNLVGVSNVYDIETLDYLADKSGVRPDIVQNRWYEGNDWDKDVVKYCAKNGISYQSFWTLTGSPTLMKFSTIISIANAKSCTIPQAIFRVAQGLGIIPLAGTTDESHMREAVESESIDLHDVRDVVQNVFRVIAK